jgi:hypothetical protein
MIGCRCNSFATDRFTGEAALFRSLMVFAALAMVLGGGPLPVRLALAQSAPTELVPPEPPPMGAPNGSGIESEPLPPPPLASQPLGSSQENPRQPGMPQAGIQQPGVQQPGIQQPRQAVPLPSVASVAPPPAAIGADLGPNLWLGSDISRLMSLIPQLPAPVSEPALRDLQLRLLTTNARPAGGVGNPLAAFRAERLNAMGFADAALALTRAAQSPVDAQGAVEQALTAGDSAGACARVDAEIAKMPVPEPFWRRALIYCQLSRKQTDQAAIALELLREQSGKDAETANFLAVAAVASGDASPKSIKKPIATSDPVLLATMNLAGVKPAAGSGATAAGPTSGPAATVATARDAAQPLSNRIAAAERAYGFGLIKREELVALYEQAPPAAGDPVADLAAADSPLARAALYQAVASTQAPDIRARLIGAAMQHGRARGDYFTEAALYAPYAQQIAPNRALAWFAPEAVRLLFLTGRADRGSFWLNIVDTVSANPAIARQAPGLRLLARLVDVPVGAAYNDDPVASWRQASGASETQAAQVYALFAGTGQRVGGWSGIAPITTNGSLASQINAAAAAGRRGETVLLSLIALKGDKLASVDPASLSASLGGLSNVGLQAEARQIAVQAAILIGL